MVSGFNYVTLTGKFSSGNQHPLTGDNKEKIKNALLNKKPIILSLEVESNLDDSITVTKLTMITTTFSAYTVYMSTGLKIIDGISVVTAAYDFSTDDAYLALSDSIL